MTLEEAKRIVFDQKPEFAALYKEYGDRTWLEYAESKYKKIPLPQTERSEELLSTFQKILSPLVGNERSNKAVETLRQNSLVSSADHHGILCHPFFSNSSLVRSHPNITASNQSIISFACGCISLSNSSYPRGIFFHDKNLEEVRMPFVSLQGRKRSLYGLSSISKNNIQKQIDRLDSIDIDKDKKNKLGAFFKKIIEDKKIWERKYFSEQITIINSILWNELFGESRGDLIYIEIETLVRELILNFHLDTNTLISKIIFEENVRNKYIENFEGIVGAHRTKERKGSHLFWYIDEAENTRKQLFLNGNQLETLDKKTSIPVISSLIKEQLLQYRLLPSMALCYSIVSFYYGVTLGGGFSQIQYLADIKKAFDKTVNKEIIDNVTNIFTGEEVLLTMSNQDNTIGATLIDLLIYGEGSINKAVDEEIENKKINDTLSYMMDEFVEIVTGTKEKISDLPKIKPTFNV
ncbi:MAG: hypothetical protein V4509_03470 [Patescibacteria group bacterium]